MSVFRQALVIYKANTSILKRLILSCLDQNAIFIDALDVHLFTLCSRYNVLICLSY